MSHDIFITGKEFHSTQTFNTDRLTDDMIPQTTKSFSSVCKDPLNCGNQAISALMNYLQSVQNYFDQVLQFMSADSMVEPVLINAWSPWSCVCISTIMIDLTMIDVLRLHAEKDSEHIEDISSPHCHESWWYWWPGALVMMWHCLSCIAMQKQKFKQENYKQAVK